MDRLDDIITWAPSRRVFYWRVFYSTVLTFVALMSVALIFAVNFNLPYLWCFLLSATLTFGFVVEDLLRWNSRKAEVWQLEGHYLIYDGSEGKTRLPLSDLDAVWTQFGMRVVLRLTNGRRLVIRDIKDAKSAERHIQAALGIATR